MYLKTFCLYFLLKKKTTRNNDIINYTYDIHGRIIKEDDVVYTYDNNNNLIKIQENEYAITRIYDGLNRVTKKTENGLVSTYTYDIEGYQEKTIDPKGNETLKTYDKTGKLIEVIGEASYLYNLDGTVKKLTYENGATEEYFYNDDKTLQKIVNTYGDTVHEYTYFYDQNKNIIKKVEDSKEILYTYDVLNRLKTVTDTDVTTYEYDKSGNRIKETTGTITKDYVYNNKNELTKITEKNGTVVTKVTTYTYDNNGNQLQELVGDVVKVTNTYNSKNELIKTVKDNVETNYTYNPEGKRIKKQNQNKTVKYVYEGSNIILELDQNNNTIASNKYGLALLSRTTDTKGYYLYNGHGDTVSIIDSNNTELKNYTYDEWGVIVSETGDFENPYTYAGYYYDKETGNYFLISRYYNPTIARFISEDSYRGIYEDPLSLNRYVYVTNNPLIYIDPEGYFGEDIGKFFNRLWEETYNLGKTAVATAHGALVATGEMVTGLGQLTIDSGTAFLYGSAALGNEVYHSLGIFGEKDYRRNLNSYTDKLIDSGKRLNPMNIITGVEENFRQTFHIENLNKFLDKDTNYFDKVDYANSATKTVATIYGLGKTGYSLGKGIYSITHPTEMVMRSVNITSLNVGKLEQIGKNYIPDRISSYHVINIHAVNTVKIARLGSTATRTPLTLKEQLALEQVKSNPLANKSGIVEYSLGDPRWKGWQKHAANVNGIEIHYNYDPINHVFDDFKLK